MFSEVQVLGGGAESLCVALRLLSRWASEFQLHSKTGDMHLVFPVPGARRGAAGAGSAPCRVDACGVQLRGREPG